MIFLSVMSSHEHDTESARIAADFVAAWDTGSPAIIADRLAERLLVGDADHTTTVRRDDLLTGMSRRAEALGAASPDAAALSATLVATEHSALGPSRLLVTATWRLARAPGRELTLLSDFLLDVTTTPATCVAYLARQTLPV